MGVWGMPLDPSKSLGQNVMATPAGRWIRFIGNLPFIIIGFVSMFPIVLILFALFGEPTAKNNGGAFAAFIVVPMGIYIGVLSKRLFKGWWLQQTQGVTIVSSTWEPPTRHEAKSTDNISPDDHSSSFQPRVLQFYSHVKRYLSNTNIELALVKSAIHRFSKHQHSRQPGDVKRRHQRHAQLQDLGGDRHFGNTTR